MEKELLRKEKLLELEREKKRKEADMAAKVLLRQQELATAEAERKEMLRRKEKALAEVSAERREAADLRKASNMKHMEQRDRSRKKEIESRAKLAEARRELREEKRKSEIKAKALEHQLELKRRAMTSAQALRDEDTRKTLLELRLAAEAEEQARIKAEQEREGFLMHEKRAIEEAAKRDAVERAKAKDDYRRLVIMRTIEDKLARGEERMRAKMEAARVRRDMSAQVLKQKHRVLRAVEMMKSPRDLGVVQVRVSRVCACFVMTPPHPPPPTPRHTITTFSLRSPPFSAT